MCTSVSSGVNLSRHIRIYGCVRRLAGLGGGAWRGRPQCLRRRPWVHGVGAQPRPRPLVHIQQRLDVDRRGRPVRRARH